jgi:hypothetical protein
MQFSRHDRVLIAWDRMDGPMFGTDGLPVYHHYRVFRDDRDVAMTYAEVFIDDDVLPSRAYRYQVKAYRDAEESSEVDAAWFSVSTSARPPADQVPPTAPSGLRGRVVGDDLLWRWNPSSKLRPDEMLGYLIESSTSGPCRAMVWERVHPTLSWTEVGAAGEERCYRVRGIDRSLNISEPSELLYFRTLPGWTVYTFSGSSSFTLLNGESIVADILAVGGGAPGGYGPEGGGGGAGEMIDKHDVTIEAGENDGDVIVGAGGEHTDGSAVPDNGGDSSFAGYTALGGGYGGTEFIDYEPLAGEGWPPNSGGSGGGGRTWHAWIWEWGEEEYGDTIPFDQYVPGDGSFWDYGVVNGTRDGGAAAGGGAQVDEWYSTHPYVTDENGDPVDAPEGGTGFWEDDDEDRFWIVSLPRGHDGKIGTSAYGGQVLAGGGGGGAHIPTRTVDGVEWPWFTYDQFGEMQSGNPFHGGHGRPCDIRGWHMYEETAHQYMYVDWYAGGGAGGPRKPGGWSWSTAATKPGYGGGGEEGQDGALGTGGGGGGGYLNVGDAQYSAGDGGRGIVVIRIRTMDESLVRHPLIVGTDPEDTEFGEPVCLSNDVMVEIRHLPEFMTHNDESGDEQCPRTYEEMH